MQKENYTRLMVIGLAITLALLLMLGYAWFTESARMADAASQIDKLTLQHGRTLYVENCVSCHGSRGEGGVGPALNNKTLLASAPDSVLFSTIKAGRPNTVMPAWGQDNGGPFTDEQINYVVAFMRAWEPNAPEVNTNTFEPSAVRGATLFAGSCAICHGEDGKGGVSNAPAINDPARLAQLDDSWYRATIANGRPAKGMPTWGTVISPNQIEDLVALIGEWRSGNQVHPETTVADLLSSATFSLSQGDSADALFYLERAKGRAFGPALAKFDPIIAQIKADQLDAALNELNQLSRDWPVGDAVKGEAVFQDACSGCHGADGQGGVGRKLKPNEFIRSGTNAEILQLVLKGRDGTAMRSFAGRLTEEQIADVIAFLRTWQ